MGKGQDRPVVIITGASSGIGDGIARRFAKAGWRIVAIARRADRLEQLQKDLGGPSEVAFVATDVTAKDAPTRAIEGAMKAFGRVDCLINNAGSFKFGAVDQVEDAALDEAIDISLKAPFRFAREAVKVMKAGSSVLSIGSVWGLRAGMGGGSYCAVKAGLIGLTQSIAADFGPRGIRANLIAPGVVKTEMTKDFWDADFFKRTNHELTPFHRECTVDDVANTAFFLASAEGSYINGQTIALDGGWSTTKYLAPEAVGAKRVAA
jgi:meso-butanediol dehydrogenase/(S,S)-butanediol dehydrogenase/diacetyl reductase